MVTVEPLDRDLAGDGSAIKARPITPYRLPIFPSKFPRTLVRHTDQPPRGRLTVELTGPKRRLSPGNAG